MSNSSPLITLLRTARHAEHAIEVAHWNNVSLPKRVLIALLSDNVMPFGHYSLIEKEVYSPKLSHAREYDARNEPVLLKLRRHAIKYTHGNAY